MVSWTPLLSNELAIIHADDDHDDDDDDDEGIFGEAFEEVGEALGWGSIILAGVAALLFPVRRIIRISSIREQVGMDKLRTGVRWLQAWHLPAGILALIIAAVHGIIQFLDEGELELREWLGIGGIALVLLAAIIGFIMKGRRVTSSLRRTHVTILIAAGALVAFHLLLS